MEKPLDVAPGWGRKVRQAREDVGFTQKKLADVCQVDTSTISRIERGEIAPTDRVKFLLAGALGKTMDDLFAYPAVRPPFPSAVGE